MKMKMRPQVPTQILLSSDAYRIYVRKKWSQEWSRITTIYSKKEARGEEFPREVPFSYFPHSLVLVNCERIRIVE